MATSGYLPFLTLQWTGGLGRVSLNAVLVNGIIWEVGIDVVGRVRMRK